MVYDDGRVEEGVARSHGAEAFVLPAVDLSEGPAAVLSAFYAGGTRFLLLHGERRLAAPFLDAGLVDEIQVLVSSRTIGGEGWSNPGAWAVVPAGFQVRRIVKHGEAVLLEAVPAEDGDQD
jgi:riboflavin biosynthesis pyrimidine reductase